MAFSTLRVIHGARASAGWFAFLRWGRRECVYVTVRRAQRYIYTQTDATSSNENKSLHILQTARRRRGARGRACQHLHTSSRWHSYAKMRDLHTHNRCCGPALSLTHTHICIKRFILIYDHDVGAKTYCFLERAVYRRPFLSHCSHFLFCGNALSNCISHYAEWEQILMQMLEEENAVKRWPMQVCAKRGFEWNEMLPGAPPLHFNGWGVLTHFVSIK